MLRWKGRVSPIEVNLGYWLHYVGYRISHELGLRTQKFGVTAAEWVVLRALYDKGAMPSHLAMRLGLTRGAISKLVDRLLAKDLVTRTASKEDRRWQDIALTPKGRALVPRLAALADVNDREFFGVLSAGERATLERILKKIVRQRDMTAVPVD